MSNIQTNPAKIIQKIGKQCCPGFASPSSICQINDQIFVKTDRTIYEFKFRPQSQTQPLQFLKVTSKLPGNAYGLKPYQDNFLATILYSQVSGSRQAELIFIETKTGNIDCSKSIVLKTNRNSSSFRFFSNLDPNSHKYFYLTCLKFDEIYQVDIQNKSLKHYGNGHILMNAYHSNNANPRQIPIGMGAAASLAYADTQKLNNQHNPHKFNQIAGPSVDNFGNVFIADSKNFRIVYVDRQQMSVNLSLAEKKAMNLDMHVKSESDANVNYREIVATGSVQLVRNNGSKFRRFRPSGLNYMNECLLRFEAKF